MRQKKIKTDNTGHFEELKNYLIKNEMDFDVIITNYTAEISGPFQIKAAKNNIEKRAFIGYQKIIKDLREYTANELPEKKDLNIYYDFNEAEIMNINGLEYLHNIDLTAAYLTILHLDGFISKETFNYCFAVLSKTERLQCVGMLAARKTVFRYQYGELVNAWPLKKETEGVFFYCVDRVQQIMEQIRNLINNDFIFSWVDSVYFVNESNISIISEYLNSINIKFKYKLLENIRVQETNNFYNIKYGNIENKNIFNLPKKEDMFKKELLRFLKLM